MSKFIEDVFLSSILQRKCYQMIPLNETFKIPFDCDFAHTKAPTEHYTDGLTAAGFKKIETSVSLTKSIKNANQSANKVSISLASKNDSEDLKKLARNLFIHDRWHSDPKIDDEIAKKLKECWIENYFSGERGDLCLVSKANEVVNGFILLINNTSTVKIDLIGVDSKFQGQGVGRELLNSISRFVNTQSCVLNVTTQLSNERSLNFYYSFGFKLKSYSSNWHFHRV